MSALGSVKRDGDRGWSFVVDVPGPGGKRKQLHRRGFGTKREAQAELAKVVTDTNRGSFVRPSKATVAAFLEDEWLPAKAATLKPSTAATYPQMVRAYIVPHIGSVPLAKVDGSVLNALYGTLLTSGRTGASGRRGGLSPKTVRNVHGMLHRAFADAVRWQRLAVNPCDAADQPRKNEPEMKVWTGEQMRTFGRASAEDRMAGVWHLLLTTGLRRGELMGLRWSDVDLDGGCLTVHQTWTMVGNAPELGTPKTRAGSRTIALDPGTASAVKSWRKQQNADRLLMGAGWANTGRVVTEPDGTAVHPQVLSRRFTVLSRTAGLPIIRFHDVRHSYATASLRAGVPVKVLSQRLGHADIAVTLRVYAHVLPGDDAAAAVLAADALMIGL